ncbi:MAG: hypothetical protein QXQ48_02150 [Nitrososphaerota archaeon]
MASPATPDLTIPLAGALGGLVVGLLGFGWGGITRRALQAAGAGAGEGLTTLLFSEILIDSGSRLLPRGNPETPQFVERGAFKWFTPITTMLASATTLGYLPAYAKPLTTLLNPLIVSYLVIYIVRREKHNTAHAVYNGGVGGAIKQGHAQCLRPPQLVAFACRLLLLAPLAMEYGMNTINIILLVIPALPLLYVSRIMAKNWGILSRRLAALALTLNAVLSLLP